MESAESENSGQSPFKPKEKYLEELIAMGVDQLIAEEALYCTDNESVEAAVNYIFNQGSIKEEDLPKEYKMVVVVNSSLKMGIGKLAAQVGHACLGLYRNMLRDKVMLEDLQNWEYYGEKKIVLRGNDEDHLLEIEKKAEELKIPCCKIRDAGRTQIPSGSLTVLSLFHTEDELNKVTGELKLL